MKRAIELFVYWTRFQKNRNLLFQISFLSIVFLLVFYLVSKALQLELSLAHFDSRAGFGISHTFLVDYSSNDSRWDAYFTGVVNTIRVCLVGIIFTTILGTIMGVARLSKNFLISKIAWSYVEILRNTPLLVQIIFWQIIFLKLPQISEALTFGKTVAISNRGILLPWFNQNDNFSPWLILMFVVTIIALAISFYLNKKEDKEGYKVNIFSIKFSGNFIGIFLILITGISSFFIFKSPLGLDVPAISQNSKGTYLQSGGFDLSPEFAAILFALVMYTGTFITEIVRGSIQSLSKGQTEAAKSVGLSNYQALTLIILPQALRSIIPPLTNQYLNLTKNSSLSVVIAYPELFMVSRTIMNNSGRALPVFFLILFTYLFLSLIISLVMNVINRRVTRIGA